MPVDAPILLEHAHDHVTHLCEGELLADADARAAVEGNVSPGLRCPVVPSLGAECRDVWEVGGGGWIVVGIALEDYG